MSEANLEYYKRLILDHNKNPRNYGVMEGFNHSAEGFNPLCGDKIQLYLCEENGTIEKAQFESQACALCKASTSMLTEKLQGMKVKDVEELQQEMNKMLSGNEIELERVAPLDVFSSVAKYPARAKCVMLPLTTVSKALKGGK
jgi:nitrogen fixation NifU-like protein